MKIRDLIRKSLNQAATPNRVRFFSITFILFTTFLLILSFTTARNRKTIFGPQLGADFASFYIAGQILNFQDGENLYDIAMQDRLYHNLLPEVSERENLPFPYAPFLGILLKPLALMSYEFAFGVWLAINLVCYIIGFLLLWLSNSDLFEHSIRLPLLVAISFEPFLIEGWIGGQMVGLTMLILGLSIYLQLKGRWLEGGVIISLCLFKPTLLLLAVPMLLLGGHLKTFSGFLIGVFVLVCVSWSVVGTPGMHGYVQLLLTYASAKASLPEAFRLEKYIDLTSFANLLSLPTEAVVIGVGFISFGIFLILCRAWWEFRGRNMRSVRLTWASVFIWTPILAPQCAIYDSILVVAAFVLIAGAHPLATPTRDANSESGFTMWAMLTYCTAFITTITAFILGIQLLTVILFGVGLWMLRVMYTYKKLEWCKFRI